MVLLIMLILLGIFEVSVEDTYCGYALRNIKKDWHSSLADLIYNIQIGLGRLLII